jgi:MFS family permease
LAALAIQILRILLLTLTADPRAMVVIQCLDGVTGAIITVLTILVITDVTGGTGRFNLAYGIFGTLTGIAGALSPMAIGVIAQHLGNPTGLVIMAAGAGIGLVLLWTFMPETKPDSYND